MTKKQSKKDPFTLHALLGALSFWGTAARGFLFGFVALMVWVVALSEATTKGAVENETMILIYVLSSFLLLDAGYVMIARAYQVLKALDILALTVAEVILALIYVVPKLVVNPDIVMRVDPLTYALFVPIIVLCLRMLVGFLYGRPQR